MGLGKDRIPVVLLQMRNQLRKIRISVACQRIDHALVGVETHQINHLINNRLGDQVTELWRHVTHTLVPFACAAARALSFLLGRLPLIPPVPPRAASTSVGAIDAAAALCTAGVKGNSGSNSRAIVRLQRFSISLKWGAVSGVTKLTATPTCPPRAVRPMRCV